MGCVLGHFLTCARETNSWDCSEFSSVSQSTSRTRVLHHSPVNFFPVPVFHHTQRSSTWKSCLAFFSSDYFVLKLDYSSVLPFDSGVEPIFCFLCLTPDVLCEARFVRLSWLRTQINVVIFSISATMWPQIDLWLMRNVKLWLTPFLLCLMCSACTAHTVWRRVFEGGGNHYERGRPVECGG